MTATSALTVRKLEPGDVAALRQAFGAGGAGRSLERFQAYLEEQAAGTRSLLLAEFDDRPAGFASVSWAPRYPPFERNRVPEIQDLSVVPGLRRRGIGNGLLDACERVVRERSPIVGIAVGLYAAYGAALRVYIKRGYVPDGAGVWYRDHHPEPGAQLVLDDELVLHFTKQLR